jgi:hypothetical protein
MANSNTRMSYMTWPIKNMVLDGRMDTDLTRR